MQTSKTFIADQNKKVIASPMEPVRSTLSAKYTLELDSIKIQIKANNEQIEKITKATIDSTSDGIKYVPYRTRKERAAIKTLTIKKDGYLGKIDKLDRQYEKEYKEFQKASHDYNIKTQQKTINWLADQAKLYYGLILVIILQIVNARFAFHGSALLKKLKEKGLDDPVGDFMEETTEKIISKLPFMKKKKEEPEATLEEKEQEVHDYIDDFEVTEDIYEGLEEETYDPFEEALDNLPHDDRMDDGIERGMKIIEEIRTEKKNTNDINTLEKEVIEEEIELRKVSPVEFLERFKISGIGKSTIESLLQKFNIKTTSDLNIFIKKTDYADRISRSFPSLTSEKLITMMTKIKDRDNE